jgi:hypothetical protein
MLVAPKPMSVMWATSQWSTGSVARSRRALRYSCQISMLMKPS